MIQSAENYLAQIDEAAAFLRSKTSEPPQVGIILGTGVGELVDEIETPVVIDYKEIPNFPESTVKFHAGRLLFGQLAGKPVCVMQGRFHYYEGYTMRQITLPVRVMHELGVSTLIVTNAAGGICQKATPGSIGLITDQINLMGTNALIGPYHERLGERFPDMSEPFSKKLRELAMSVANRIGINLLETVYAAVTGPSFETAAEIRMLQKIGVDTVGMSVVPEVLTARQIGLDVLGLTIVTDQSLPDHMVTIEHAEVKKVAEETLPALKRLVKGILSELN